MAQATDLMARAKLQVERARARYGTVDIIVATFKRYSADDGGSYAAALTYYIFFSIFPMLLFAVAALGYVTFVNPEFKADIFEAARDSFPMLKNVVGPKGLSFIQDRRGTLALSSVLLALYAGSGGVVALQHALNRVWHVESEPNWIGKRLRSLVWLAILGLGAVASAALGALAEYSGGESLVEVATMWAARLGGVGVSFVMFATAFRFLPARSSSWREVAPGAAIAAAVFELLKIGGQFYIATGMQARRATFGAFATAAGLLVASYLLAQVTLLAAEVNAVLAERRVTRHSSVVAGRAGEAT